VLETSQVVKSFSGFHALAGCSLESARGSIDRRQISVVVGALSNREGPRKVPASKLVTVIP